MNFHVLQEHFENLCMYVDILFLEFRKKINVFIGVLCRELVRFCSRVRILATSSIVPPFRRPASDWSIFVTAKF